MSEKIREKVHDIVNPTEIEKQQPLQEVKDKVQEYVQSSAGTDDVIGFHPEERLKKDEKIEGREEWSKIGGESFKRNTEQK